MLRRIILHWTAGHYFPNQTDLSHYHFLVTGNGQILKGKHPPEANIVCKEGYYAMHTLKGNTGSIGVAMCGMCGFVRPSLNCEYLITPIQTEHCFELCASLCKKYSILPTPGHITTHYHYNKKHKIKTGKIDITFLPPYPNIMASELENFIADKVKWYYKNL